MLFYILSQIDFYDAIDLFTCCLSVENEFSQPWSPDLAMTHQLSCQLESRLERKFRLNDCIIVYTSIENSGSSGSASSRVFTTTFRDVLILQVAVDDCSTSSPRGSRPSNGSISRVVVSSTRLCS